MTEDTTLLLGLDGLTVDHVELASDGARVVHVVTACPTATICPSCGVASSARKQRTATTPRDLPYGTDPIRLVWHKNRWHCHQPDCPKKTFTESVPQIPLRTRITDRLRKAAGRAVADTARTVDGVARELGLSWPVTHTAFVEHAATMLPESPQPVAVLGIDETRRGRPRFTRDPDTAATVVLADRWHTGFVDIGGDQGLLGQVEGRTADDAAYWLHQVGAAWRVQVQVVVIDMSTIYASAVRRMLPQARLAVDPFHVVQLATKMVGDVRRRVVRDKYGRRGRSGDAEYGVKNLLVRNREHLTPAQFDKILSTLDSDAAGQQILLAWIAKEKLRDLIRLREPICGTHPTPERIRHHLHEFFAWCATYDHIGELVSLARTIDRWRDPIITAIQLGVSNAKSEGLNRVIKLEGRKAYGFRNATNQRRRLRYATTHTSRRPPTATKPRSRTVINRQHDPG